MTGEIAVARRGQPRQVAGSKARESAGRSGASSRLTGQAWRPMQSRDAGSEHGHGIDSRIPTHTGRGKAVRAETIALDSLRRRAAGVQRIALVAGREPGALGCRHRSAPPGGRDRGARRLARRTRCPHRVPLPGGAGLGTLVELMLGVTLGFLISGVVLSLYVNTGRSLAQNALQRCSRARRGIGHGAG